MKKNMKNLSLLFISVLSIVALTACDDRGDIRKDVDDLNARLDILQVGMKKINIDLNSYKGILEGSIQITGYSVNEFGDYTVTFSDGNSMVIYGGEMEQDIPVIGIGEDGWYYTERGDVYPLVDADGEQIPAFGEDGKTPSVRVNKSGMWEYSFDGVTWIKGFGTALPKNGVSIFDEVSFDEETNSLLFKWHTGEVHHEATIALYGLNLTIQNAENNRFGLGESRSFAVEQIGVDKAVVETNNWEVKLNENQLMITAPDTADEEIIRIKIFSKSGYCKLVCIQVICTIQDGGN